MVNRKTVNLNTGEGENSAALLLKGCLDSMIITATKKVEIAIESERGFTVFHTKEIGGTHYLPIRVLPIDKNHQLIKFANAAKYILNEKVLITVIGQADTEIEVDFILKDLI